MYLNRRVFVMNSRDYPFMPSGLKPLTMDRYIYISNLKNVWFDFSITIYNESFCT